MNWLDGVLIALIVAGTLIGVRTGLLGGVIMGSGSLGGWVLAERFEDDVASFLGQSSEGTTWVTILVYAIIIVLALITANLVGRIVLATLSKITLGLSDLVNRLGRVPMGIALGFVVAGALAVALAGYAYDRDFQDDGAPDGEESKRAIGKALTGSSMVSLFIDIKQALPDRALKVLSEDLRYSLDTLEQNIKTERRA